MTMVLSAVYFNLSDIYSVLFCSNKYVPTTDIYMKLFASSKIHIYLQKPLLS